jgi:hypothetical protein
MTWIGGRLADRAVPAIASSESAAPSAVFYREGYVRYDLKQHLVGPLALGAVGSHRRRYEPMTLNEPWFEGENYVTLHWEPQLSFMFGYEYQTREGLSLPTHYLNGGIQYSARTDEPVLDGLFDTVRLFVGQRRAALRCIAGICRLYPAYEGARLEMVSRF